MKCPILKSNLQISKISKYLKCLIWGSIQWEYCVQLVFLVFHISGYYFWRRIMVESSDRISRQLLQSTFSSVSLWKETIYTMETHAHDVYCTCMHVHVYIYKYIYFCFAVRIVLKCCDKGQVWFCCTKESWSLERYIRILLLLVYMCNLYKQTQAFVFSKPEMRIFCKAS